jgi:hypothetical protein
MTTITKLERNYRAEKTETVALNKMSFEALNGSKELEFNGKKSNGNTDLVFQNFNRIKCAFIVMFLVAPTSTILWLLIQAI